MLFDFQDSFHFMSQRITSGDKFPENGCRLGPMECTLNIYVDFLAHIQIQFNVLHQLCILAIKWYTSKLIAILHRFADDNCLFGATSQLLETILECLVESPISSPFPVSSLSSDSTSREGCQKMSPPQRGSKQLPWAI